MSARRKLKRVGAVALGAAALLGLIGAVWWREGGTKRIAFPSHTENGAPSRPRGEVSAFNGDHRQAQRIDHDTENPLPPKAAADAPAQEANGKIMGVIYSLEGDLMADTSLKFYRWEQLVNERKTAFSVTSDENGFYQSREVPPGLYHVAVSHRVPRTEGTGLRCQVRVAEAEVLPGETTVCDVVFEEGRTLSGRYTVAPDDLQADIDGDGRPEPQTLLLMISLWEKRFPDQVIAFAETTVYPMPYDQWHRRSRGASREERHLTPEQIAEWMRTEKLERTRAEQEGTAPIDPSGYFRFVGLPPGEYIIRILFAQTVEGEEIYLERYVDLTDHDVDLPPEQFREEVYMEAFWARQEARQEARQAAQEGE